MEIIYIDPANNAIISGNDLLAEPSPMLFTLYLMTPAEYLREGLTDILPRVDGWTPKYILEKKGYPVVSSIDLLRDLSLCVSGIDKEALDEPGLKIFMVSGDGKVSIPLENSLEISLAEAGEEHILNKYIKEIEGKIMELDATRRYVIYRTFRKSCGGVGAFWDKIIIHAGDTPAAVDGRAGRLC